jgi:imidazolonepropionase-like amidohydrolase
MKRILTLTCGLLASVLPIFAQTSAKRAAEPTVDEGTLLIVFNGRLKGSESYRMTSQADSVALHSIIQYSDPFSGHNMSISSDMRVRYGRFQRLEIMGYTPSGARIHTAVAIDEADIVVTEGEESKRQRAPSQFFAITGSLPATMHTLLFRYWAAHGQPQTLRVFPDRNVAIQYRGEDTIELFGRSVSLKRYAVSGVLWCRETMWMDSEQRVVALITNYASSDVPMPVQAVRDGYLAALPFFVKKAAEDNEAEFARLADRIAPPRHRKLALIGGTLVDGTGHPPISDSIVVLDGDRIIAVGRRLEIKVPPDTELMDVTGKTVLPGLWDMHLHSFTTEWVVGELAGGITTARDCGSQFEFITAVRNAIQSGHGLGPRLLLAGTMDTSGEPTEGGMELRVLSPEDARETVQRYHDAGFVQSKVFEDMTPELLRTIAEESHRLNMAVTGHLPAELTPFQAIEAGMDGIEHTMYVLPAFVSKGTAPPVDTPGIDKLELLALQADLSSGQFKDAVQFIMEHKTVLDPTLVIGERYGHSNTTPMETFQPGVDKMPSELASPLKALGLPPASAEVWERAFEKELQLVGALYKAGVTIVAGSDARIPSHEFYRELELLVRAGLTPMEAIQAATIVPARVMKLDKELGSISSGKRADLIIVDGNPTENISLIRNVKTVFKDGRIYESAKLWESIGFKP